MEYYLAIKNNELFPFAATWMDLKNIMISEISQTKTNFIWYHSYMDYKNNTNKCIYKIETDSQTQKTNLRSPTGRVRGEGQVRGMGLTNTSCYT